ncbi:hypothetical protein [Gemmata sp.]|uniref:hypothetical protein n=1 Tax=Gemmata sp. TaxID=1914242 RepID=UPI003F729431
MVSRLNCAGVAKPHSFAIRRTPRSVFARYTSDTSAAISERSYAIKCSSSGTVACRAASSAFRSRVPALTCSTSRSHFFNSCSAACRSRHPVGFVTTIPPASRNLAK